MSITKTVARAICKAEAKWLSQDHTPTQEFVDNNWKNHIPEAEAAIEAIQNDHIIIDLSTGYSITEEDLHK